MKKWPLAFLLVPLLVGLRFYLTKGRDESAPPSTVPASSTPTITLDDLRHPDPERREKAIRALGHGHLGPDGRPPAAETVPLLVELLRTDRRVRDASIWSLGRMGPEAVPLLVEALREENRLMVQWAAAVFAVDRLGPAALPPVLLIPRAEEQLFERAVGSALGQMGKAITPQLVEALHDREGGAVRAATALALGILGPEAAEGVPALIEFLNEDNDDVSGAICFALGQIGRPAVPRLRVALKDANPTVRANAAAALTWGVDRKRMALTLSFRNLAELEYDTREAKKSALPELFAALEDMNPRVRFFAALAIQDLDPESQRKTVPVLVGLVRGNDLWLRERAGDILLQIDPEAAREAGVP
jgi:HEAT repeat protein